jgi:RHS repeat-associated protein
MKSTNASQCAQTGRLQTTQTGTSSGNSQQYTARENDGTGLYYYRARYYSPGTGRFISEDPVGFAGGNNIYAYTGGDPISGKDPSGLLPWPSIATGAQGEAAAEAMAAAMNGQDPGSAAMSAAAQGAATGAAGDGPAGAAASALGGALTAPPGQAGMGAMKGALLSMAPADLGLPLAMTAIADRAADLIGKLAQLIACL